LSAAFLFCALTNGLCVAKLTVTYGIREDIFMLKKDFATQVQATPPIGIKPEGGILDAPVVLGERPLGNPGL